MMEDIVFG